MQRLNSDIDTLVRVIDSGHSHHEKLELKNKTFHMQPLVMAELLLILAIRYL
jgi:hypothetical protein